MFCFVVVGDCLLRYCGGLFGLFIVVVALIGEFDQHYDHYLEKQLLTTVWTALFIIPPQPFADNKKVPTLFLC